jgi:hypothetical protein
MPTGKSIIRFILTACCLYALLLGFWPVFAGVYATSFRTMGGIAFHTFGSSGTVRFESIASPSERDFDCIVRVHNTRTGAGLSQTASSKLLGYIPTIMTMSVFIATVAADRRRWRSLIAAMAVIHVFIALRLAIMLLDLFSGKDHVAQFDFGGATRGVIGFLNDLFTQSLTMNCVVPLVLWMALVVSRSGPLNRCDRRLATPNTGVPTPRESYSHKRR